jgi:hypothetical protein
MLLSSIYRVPRVYPGRWIESESSLELAMGYDQSTGRQKTCELKLQIQTHALGVELKKRSVRGRPSTKKGPQASLAFRLLNSYLIAAFDEITNPFGCTLPLCATAIQVYSNKRNPYLEFPKEGKTAASHS